MATTSTTADDYDDEFAAEEDVNCEFTMTTRPEVMGAAMQALVGNALFDFEHVHRFSQLAPGYLVANFINVQDPVATVFDAAHPPPNPYTGNLASAKVPVVVRTTNRADRLRWRWATTCARLCASTGAFLARLSAPFRWGTRPVWAHCMCVPRRSCAVPAGHTICGDVVAGTTRTR
eukprot:TRINITY_DN403_c1_g1_i4.p1 TRINITY_DN403_c1_g1~~TRINITY_DN403_c1_g1_i4.p1  ORF type:complete len:176 (-),score=11.18 TRINITY_DN403_c1_g1_i4:144-671(-)